MLSNTILKQNKKYSLYYYTTDKLNIKYKKLIKYNCYSKIYNPRKEINIFDKILIKKNKFHIY